MTKQDKTFQKTSEGIDLGRRHFLIGGAATGIVLTYAATSSFTEAVAQGLGSYAPSVWYEIAKNGKVTVNVAKADMGQHIASTMAQLVAEELGAKWSDMNIALASNDPKYGDPVLGAIITGGSWSTGMNFDAMCRAGAAGRMTLIETGAGMMGVPADECHASGSRVTHKSGKALTFAQIVSSGRANKTWTPDELKAIKLKTPDQYTLIGQSVPQLDIPSKTTGAAKYGIDAFLPTLKAQTEAHIVNTASIAGLIAYPRIPIHYNASKYAVVGISETLKGELAETNVGVSVLCPGFVRTNIRESQRNRPTELRNEKRNERGRAMDAAVVSQRSIPVIQPDEVAALVYNAVMADRFWIFTHPELMAAVEDRYAGVLTDAKAIGWASS